MARRTAYRYRKRKEAELQRLQAQVGQVLSKVAFSFTKVLLYYSLLYFCLKNDSDSEPDQLPERAHQPLVQNVSKLKKNKNKHYCGISLQYSSPFCYILQYSDGETTDGNSSEILDIVSSGGSGPDRNQDSHSDIEQVNLENMDNIVQVLRNVSIINTMF